MFIGASTYFRVAWDRFELSVGFSFSIPQDGLIMESLHCEIYASTGWIPVTKDASCVASKDYMSIVIGSVSQIMTRYISIDINKASP